MVTPVLTASFAIADPAPADPKIYGLDLTNDDYNHWSFKPISRVSPPAPQKQGEWVRNPLDAFILQKLHAAGLEPSLPADDRIWLRRVTFDLVGLPPTSEQMDEFLADQSANKREKVVDRLLADPGYGVRWGRRWLDVVRYADTNGYERDGAKPQAWRYRDWVIESLNADKPFDRFLTEQLAGDEMEETTAETMVATTFLRLGTWDDEPADPKVDRYDQLDDIVGTVSATFLGLTLRCARCHNHKFEPLSQIDYTRMLAIFEPLQRPQDGRTDLDVAVGTRRELEEHRASDARRDAAIKAVKTQIAALDDQVRDRFFSAGQSQLSPEAIAAHKRPADQRNDEQKKLVKETQKQYDQELGAARTPDETKQRDGFDKAIAAILAAAPAPLPRAYIWNEPAEKLPLTQIFRRGNPTTPAGSVEPGFPAVLKASHVGLQSPGEKPRSSLRRLSLAKWMTDPKNPLTARVIVNRLWQGHFGNGLVGTENDFGVMGDLPSHPELLDYLASQLREDGWSLKRLHKLIVLSNTYGQASDRREEASKKDVDNRLLWRFPYRRLDAEAVRDSVLAISGLLNPKMGGPGVYPRIAREVLEGQSRPGEGWGKSDEKEASRRSAYIFVKRAMIVPEMEILDFADTNTSCEQRPVSTIPTQALTLMNGEFLNTQARQFAERLVKEAGSDRTAQVIHAYRLAVNRSPIEKEQASALAFLARQEARIAEEDKAAGATPRDASIAALQALCLVILNLNEFAYVD